MAERNQHSIDDEREDAATWRMLTHHVPTAVAPPDLVARTTRRLPHSTPAQVMRAQMRYRTGRRMAVAVASSAVTVLALLGLFDVLGAGPQLSTLVGNGSIGHALLVIRLLIKPLLGTLFSAAPLLVVASAVIAVCSGTAWWLLLQRTPAVAPAMERSQ